MGMFKDIRNLQKQAKEMTPPEHRGFGGGIRSMKDGLAQASEGLAQANQTMADLNQQHQNEAMLMSSGIVGQATILAIADTGATVNQNPDIRFTLNVQIPGEPAYEATMSQVVSRLSVFNYQPGTVVPVRVSPNDHQILMIG